VLEEALPVAVDLSGEVSHIRPIPGTEIWDAYWELLLLDLPPTPAHRGRDPAIQARENILFLADQDVGSRQSNLHPLIIDLLRYSNHVGLSSDE
jgi:hypothetical protein